MQIHRICCQENEPAQFLPRDTHPTVVKSYELQQKLTLRQLAGDTPMAMIHWNTANSVRTYFLKLLSRGTVAINSTNPLEPPLIDFQTMVDPVDFDLVVAAFLKNRHIMSQPTMAVLGPQEASPFADKITNEGQLKEILRGVIEPSSAHQSGTAAIMPEELGGVVDPQMNVYGAKGLRVIDTSYWPMALTSAPTATTYASGEKVRLCGHGEGK